MFIYLTSGLFFFGMAGMRQMLAMAIGLWAVHYGVNRKWVPFVLLLFIAFTIHPFVLFYGMAPFLQNKIWSSKRIFFTFRRYFSWIIF
jgi:hypothetical protein